MQASRDGSPRANRLFGWRRSAPVAFLVLALAAATPAQEKPDLDRDLRGARTLMKDGQWARAATAFLAVFQGHAGSPEVNRRIAEIEADLKYCLFRSKAKEPKPADLFGEAVKSLNMRSGKITLKYPHGPESPAWTGTRGRHGVLGIPFAGDITVEFRVNCWHNREAFSPFAALCLDAKGDTGYRLYPGFYVEEPSVLDTISVYSDDARVVRLDAGNGKEDLVRDRETSQARRPWMTCRATRKGSVLTILANGKVRATASDGNYRGGYVAVSGGSVMLIEIQGTVEESHLQAVQEEWFRRGFADWASASWDRAAVIPAWALRTPGTDSAPGALLLPGDAPVPHPASLVEAMDAWVLGDRDRFLSLSSKLEGLPNRTKRYIHALRNFALGRLAQAGKALDGILEEEPSFAGARLQRGILRLRLRETGSAGADLKEARGAAASLPMLHEALADLALQEGSPERALAHLEAARAAGALTPDLEGLAVRLRNCAEGLPWTRKFEASNRIAIVASDHSLELCREVAGLLEGAFATFRREIPGTADPPGPLRILAFSRRDEFLAFSLGLGRASEGGTGVYLPDLRTMVLLVEEPGGEGIRTTARREGLRAFLDGNLGVIPPWFVEGFALRFEAAREKDGVLVPDPIHPAAVASIRERAGSPPTPLGTLLLMDRAAFQRSPAAHGADAWAFLRYLLESGSPPGRTLVAEYFWSLRSGLSPDEAYRKDLEPHMPVLEPGLPAWVAENLLK